MLAPDPEHEHVATPRSIRANKVAWTVCLVGLVLALVTIVLQAGIINHLVDLLAEPARLPPVIKIHGQEYDYICVIREIDGSAPMYDCTAKAR